jgi:hypothetical protein
MSRYIINIVWPVFDILKEDIKSIKSWTLYVLRDWVYATYLLQICLNFMAQYLFFGGVFFFGSFTVFTIFFRISNFFGLSTWLVEMCIWCIKIGIVLVLHLKRIKRNQTICMQHVYILLKQWLVPTLVFTCTNENMRNKSISLICSILEIRITFFGYDLRNRGLVSQQASTSWRTLNAKQGWKFVERIAYSWWRLLWRKHSWWDVNRQSIFPMQ